MDQSLSQTATSDAGKDGTLRDRIGIPALVAATIISNTGNNVTAIALPWFVLITTGSASRTGLVAFAGLLPVLIAGLFGGLLVDRIGYRTASVINDILNGLTMAMMPTLHLLGVLQFWHLLVLAFFGSIFDVPGGAARDSLIPQLAARAGMSLERANSARQLGIYVAMLGGPAVAGILIAAFGATTVLYFDAVSFVLSALIIGLLVPYHRSTPPATEIADDQPASSILTDALQGVRILMRDPVLRFLVSASLIANFLFSPMFAVIFPVYVKENFGSPQTLGYLIASFGGGSIVGTLGYALIGTRWRRYPLFVVGLLSMSGGLWLLPLAHSVTVSITGALISGAAVGPINTTVTVLVQERVPPQSFGRVFASLTSMAMLASPLGVLLAGFAVEATSPRLTLGFIALVFTLTSLVSVSSRNLRAIDTPGASTESDITPT